ncbi:MAG: bifunctional oligoribonuclease/PAP phosphatase NrnA [Lachnospiraceae bacterium]|nr:bifunctional oligoribonuclease/PAP phosphatase NrnA [Lachnospiraceae bacterium]
MFQLTEEIKGARSIGISGHIRPDGDCVGSAMALYLYLQKITEAGTEVSVYLEQPPETFGAIKGIEQIQTEASEDKVYDVFFALDCEKSRLGFAEKLFEQAKKTINVDHHISNLGCGRVNYVVPTVSSTSELIYDLLDKEQMDRDIAMAIYTGIIHDTGVFQYSNTSPKTMRIAADLLEYGFDFSTLIEESFYQKTYWQNQIMGRALLESIMFLNGRCIVSAVDRKLMEFYHATPKDLDGIVNQLKIIKGVECAVFMYETDNLEYKVSMRSTDRVDVAKVASYFGGGGHKKAAGCTMKGTFHDVINNLSLHIERQLNGETN